ncbi:MAG: DUF481 domain-containing protein, partial [Sphingobacteriales bacterium]
LPASSVVWWELPCDKNCAQIYRGNCSDTQQVLLSSGGLNMRIHRSIRCSLHFLLALLLVLSVTNGYAQTKVKDTIIMKDGTVLSGELKGLKSGRLEFDIDNISIVKIKFDRIRLVKAITHQYRVETSDRKIYFGFIRRSDSTGILRILTKDSAVLIPLDKIAFMTSYDGSSFMHVRGYVSSGFTYARSSNAGRFNFDAAIAWQFERVRTDLTGSMFVSQTDTTWVRDRENLNLQSFYLINSYLSVGGMVKYQRNYELGLARRFQEGLGIVYNWLSRNNFQVKSLTGLVFNQERNIEGQSFSNQIEVPLTIQAEFFKFSKPNISVNTSQSAYISLTDPGRLRWDGDTRISWELIEDLALSIQIYHNFDNRPPSGDPRSWDYGTVLGLKYTF